MSRFRMSVVVSMCLTVLLAAAPGDVSVVGNSPVADATMLGQLDTVRSLLKQGVDVNASQGDGMTALHWAASKGSVEMAEMLLYAGANIRAATRLGAYTPLLMASKSGNALMVETLLGSGADVNDATKSGTTPLMFAAASGSLDAVRTLLDHGADLNAVEGFEGATALWYAASYNRSGVIDLMIERGADFSVATKTVDMAEMEKKAAAEREKRGEPIFGGGGQGQRSPSAQAGAEEDGEAEKVAREPTPSASAKAGEAQQSREGEQSPEANKEANEEANEDQSFLVRMFSWIPGVGEKKEDTEVRRRSPRRPFGQLVGDHGGMTPLHVAARQGHRASVEVLVEAGADVNVRSGDNTTPLLIATINGRFDVGKYLLDRGADPNLSSDAGAMPLFAAINVHWAPKALYPQPRAHLQQELTHLDFMKELLASGAELNTRLKKKLWYSSYNFDLSGVDEGGATPFWRAAYASDVEAMKLLVAGGADPNIPTIKPEGLDDFDATLTDSEDKDLSGLAPVPAGGASVTPLAAACGVGYGKGFAANSHRYAPTGFMPAIQYLVEELGADVNARDHEGYTPLHHCASRGDTECIAYLVSKGTDVSVVSRKGQTTADMANGPVQRVQPFLEAVLLLEKLGSKNSHNCVSC